MPTIDTQAGPIFYRRYQAKEAAGSSCPPLVLVHGAGGTLMTWPPQIRRLAGATVYALDLPGHGESPVSGLTNIGAYRDSVLALVEALKLPPFVIAGHSMGGAIALEIALHEPAWLAGLILLGAAAKLTVAQRLLDGLNADYPGTVDWLVPLLFGEDVDMQLRDEYRRQMLALEPALLLDDFSACNAFDVRDQLAEVSLPTLIMCGRADRMTPSRFSQNLHDTLPGSEYHMIEGAGHMIMLERTDMVADHIQDFLARRFANQNS